MMKKICALLLSLVMLLSVSALADSELQFVFDETAASYEGVWTDMGVGVAMYLPVDWQEMEVPEDQAAKGVTAILASEDTSMALAIVVGLALDAAGNQVTDIVSLAAILAGGGYEEVNVLTVNGIPAVVYEQTAGDVIALAYLTTEGYMVSFTFTPKSNEAAATLGSIILLSASVIAAE